MIIWLFGQPCSGKTTLARKLLDSKFTKNKIHLIDGDAFREVFQNNSYNREGRLKNIERASIVARYMESCGFTVICSFVTPYKEMRDNIREISKDLKFIYLDYLGERGREAYHVQDFEIPNPKEEHFLHLRTSDINIGNAVIKIKEYL